MSQRRDQSDEYEDLTFEERMSHKKRFQVKEINGCFYPVDQNGNVIGNPPSQDAPQQPSSPRAPTPTFETDNASLQERIERSQNRRGGASQGMAQAQVPQVLGRQVVSLEESRVRPEVRAALNMQPQTPLPSFTMEAPPTVRPTRKEFREMQAYKKFQPVTAPKPRMKKQTSSPAPVKTASSLMAPAASKTPVGMKTPHAPKTPAPKKSEKVIAVEAALKARSWHENTTRQPNLPQAPNQSAQATRAAEHQAVQIAALWQQVARLQAENRNLKEQLNSRQ